MHPHYLIEEDHTDPEAIQYRVITVYTSGGIELRHREADRVFANRKHAMEWIAASYKVPPRRISVPPPPS